MHHILETGLTLLAHSHLSNKYWVDAFLTSVYLINQLPTPILDNVSPFFKLHQKEPNYQQLKVFGCKCYPLLCPIGLHKLEFRSKPCLLLGYCYARYKCLDPITNKVYLSRHVVFDEHTFPNKDKVPIHLPSKVNASGDQPFIHQVSFLSPNSFQNLSPEPITYADDEPSNPIQLASSPPNILESLVLSTHNLQDTFAVQPQPTNQNSSPSLPNFQAASDLSVDQLQPITSPDSHTTNQPNSSPP